ncbi:MAG TPA: hypothetical protein VJT31_12920 [Rugosimonospora sp.]|nr:hypothetical protein [Rugosimonospora sp.]
MRDFDPVRLGGHETGAWVNYYRRRWLAVLGDAVGMVRTGFGMSWPNTLLGAWYVLRGNQLWAPVPDNDPDGARQAMRKFYALVVRATGESFDVDEAARLEVEWWRVHRDRQHGPSTLDNLTDAVAALYAHVYRVPAGSVREAARHRAVAMDISDRWVAAGRDPASPDIAAERAELIEGYRLLRAAVLGAGGAAPGPAGG